MFCSLNSFLFETMHLCWLLTLCQISNSTHIVTYTQCDTVQLATVFFTVYSIAMTLTSTWLTPIWKCHSVSVLLKLISNFVHKIACMYIKQSNQSYKCSFGHTLCSLQLIKSYSMEKMHLFCWGLVYCGQENYQPDCSLCVDLLHSQKSFS